MLVRCSGQPTQALCDVECNAICTLPASWSFVLPLSFSLRSMHWYGRTRIQEKFCAFPARLSGGGDFHPHDPDAAKYP